MTGPQRSWLYLTAGRADFTCDAKGNLISAGATTYSYDSENRLTGAGGGISLAYDPAGRLHQVAGTWTKRMLYDGVDRIAEYDGSGALLRRFVHGPGTDEPLLWYEGATRNWLHADERGSIVAVTNNEGAVVGINAYDEFGIPATPVAGSFAYTGQAWFPELGMYHYKARIYSPTLGRFLQTDPVGYEDQVNLYAYVDNDPSNLTDPDGMEAPCVTLNRPCLAPNADPFGDMYRFFTEDIARAFREPSVKNVSVALISITPVGRGLTKAYGAIRILQASAAFGSAGAKALWSAARPAVQGLRQGGGRVIASGAAPATSKDYFRNAGDFANRFGGSPSDYQKVSTGTIATTAEGAKIEVHAVRNADTGKLYDLKYKVQGGRIDPH